MNNCIGEKNRVIFIIFLGLQFAQFLVGTVDVFGIILREEDVANEVRIFWAIVLASLAYHAYEGVAFRDDEKPRLQADLGDKTFMVLRNHGLLTVGAGVAEAFQAMYLFETVCSIQIRALAGGGELMHIAPELIATAGQQAREVTRGLGAQLVSPGLLRRLDRRCPGYDR